MKLNWARARIRRWEFSQRVGTKRLKGKAVVYRVFCGIMFRADLRLSSCKCEVLRGENKNVF